MPTVIKQIIGFAKVELVGCVTFETVNSVNIDFEKMRFVVQQCCWFRNTSSAQQCWYFVLAFSYRTCRLYFYRREIIILFCSTLTNFFFLLIHCTALIKILWIINFYGSLEILNSISTSSFKKKKIKIIKLCFKHLIYSYFISLFLFLKMSESYLLL